MQSPRIVIVDYGTGNHNSVKKALDRLSLKVAVTSSAADIAAADKIILPGVGHFGRAMTNLTERGLIDCLNDAALKRNTPILGICLGMELLAKGSDEADVEGLGWLDAYARRVEVPNASRYKVPHMGWNGVRIRKASRLMDGIDESAEFYFAHSYHLELEEPAAIVSETEYGSVFVSAIEQGNIFGVQYHPEKSHDAGMRLLKNFVEM